MSKKRILIISEYFYPEEFKINEVALAWKEKGYDVDVLTQNPTYPIGNIYDGYDNKWYSKEVYEEINIFRVKAVTGYKVNLLKKLLKYFTFMFLGSIISLKIGRKYDYVFGFDVGALTGMVPAIMLKKFYNKPTTLWIQDIWPDSVYAYGFKKTKILEFFMTKFVKFVYRNTSNFAISGKGFEKRILPYIHEEKEIMYAPNWADELNKNLEKFSFSENNKINFTFAGNIGKVQNLENVIIAFKSLTGKDKKMAQLNIIGDGSELDNLKRLVNIHDSSEVVFWGKKPRNEMYRYFNASDFLIVSLIDKPIFLLTVPAKIQTYIAASKPILGIINGDAANIIKENNLGYCTRPDSVDEIRAVFLKAINANKNEIDDFTKNCKVLTSTTFNKKTIIENLLILLRG